MTIVPPPPYTLSNGEVADATQLMANLNSAVQNVNASAAHNGVNSDITALTALTVPLSVSQGGTGTTAAIPPAGYVLVSNGTAYVPQPVGAAVTDATIPITDITTNNVSISRHGFCPKSPNNSALFLDGTGGYSAPVATAAYNGAVANNSVGQHITAFTTGFIGCDQSSIDTNSYHDNVTNNSRMTVPSGVGKVRFSVNFSFSPSVVGDEYGCFVLKNGAGNMGGLGGAIVGDTFGGSFTFTTPLALCSPGDYFQVQVTNGGTGTITAFATFEMQVLG